MPKIILSTSELPITNYGARYIASTSFLHTDRIADFHVMIYVTKGQIFVTEADKEYVINEGELLFLKSGVHHYGTKLIKPGTTWYYIHFYTQPFHDSYKNASGTFSYQPYSPSMDLNLPITQKENALYFMVLPKKLTNLKDTSLSQSIEDFISFIHSGRPYRRWELNTRLFQLLSDCVFFEEKNTMLPFSLSDRIALYLQNHVHEPFKASLLEKHFYLTYKHMEFVFKQEKNSTIQQYHTKLRLYQACDLLHATDFSICEISETLGFSDQLYFSRCFHKGLGMSPSEYRKRLPIS